jgi:hypothetical protein
MISVDPKSTEVMSAASASGVATVEERRIADATDAAANLENTFFSAFKAVEGLLLETGANALALETAKNATTEEIFILLLFYY